MNAGATPDDVVVTDQDGLPDFAFRLSELDAAALALAGKLAAESDKPGRVPIHLEAVAQAHVGNSIYLSGLLLRTLRFLSEDLLAPLLQIAEEACPGHDFRAQLHKVGHPDEEAEK